MKFIRVNMPVGSPDGTLKLSKKTSDKHTALGVGSPLTGFVDMTVFETNRASALALQEAGDAAGNTAQSKHNQCAKLCGIAEGQNKQTENTIYWFTLQSRDVLLLKHKGTEEDLEEYGFNVVISQTGARKNVRVDIPDDNPANLLALAQAIIDKHTALGVGSPLTGNVDMTLFGSTTASATTLLGDWDTQRNLAQSKHNQALNIIGYGEGQTSQTAGTLYYDLLTTRDRLLQFYSGAEEQLQEWGFDVVISSARPGKTKGGTVIFFTEGDVLPGAVANIPINDIPGDEIDAVTFEATGSPLRFYAAAGATDQPGGDFLEVQADTKETLTVQQIDEQLGFNDTNTLLNVKNQSPLPGHYKVSVKVL